MLRWFKKTCRYLMEAVVYRVVGIGEDADCSLTDEDQCEMAGRGCMDVHFQPALFGNLDMIAEIDRQSFSSALSRQELVYWLYKPGVKIRVALYDGLVIAYAMYCLKPEEVLLIRLAVHPHFRRMYVGTRFVGELYKIVQNPDLSQTSLAVNVRETNLHAQLFFRYNGLRCEEIKSEVFEDTGELVYVMRARQEQLSENVRVRWC